MHPAVESLSFLLGTWEGEGCGLWSADPVFRYRERVDFTEQDGPFVTYRQQTTTLDRSRRLHTEIGYLRPGPESTVELVLAQPTGLVEVHAGRVIDQRIELRSLLVGRAPRAVAVTDVTRTIHVSDTTYFYELGLAMNDEPVAPHLAGRLERADAD